MRSQKISFIVVWKIAGLLVIPKNITRSLKRPQLVQKVAFNSSLGLIWILLKLQQTFNLVKYLASWSWNISLEIRKSGYLLLIITALRLLQFCTNWREPFFFLIKNTGAAIGDLEGYIQPVWRFLREIYQVLTILQGTGNIPWRT